MADPDPSSISDAAEVYLVGADLAASAFEQLVELIRDWKTGIDLLAEADPTQGPLLAEAFALALRNGADALESLFPR